MTQLEGRALIAKYFPDYSDDQIDQLVAYVDLLLETNQQINLISRKSEEHVWIDHILHSLSIGKVLQSKAPLKILDFGTGGGLPGIPLAIAYPQHEYLLIDSIGKKMREVSRMSEELGLDNVRTQHGRVEDLNGQFDFAVSRAVSSLPKMQEWLSGLIKPGNTASVPNGLIYIKGGDFDEELESLKKAFQVWELKELFEEAFFETKKVVWIDFAT